MIRAALLPPGPIVPAARVFAALLWVVAPASTNPVLAQLVLQPPVESPATQPAAPRLQPAPARPAPQGLPPRVEGMNPAAAPAPPRQARPAPAKPVAPAAASQTARPGSLPQGTLALPGSPAEPSVRPSPPQQRVQPAARPPAAAAKPPARGAAPNPAQAVAPSPARPGAPPSAQSAEPVRDPPPPLQAPDLSAVLVFVDPAPAARRSPFLMPADARPSPAGPSPIRLSRPPRPLYVSEILSSPRIPLFETVMQAPDFGEQAPVALNSFDAIKAGVPAGPYRAGLIEENETDPDRPKIHPGTVSWKVLPGPEPGPNAPPAALVADLEIETTGLRARFTMRPVREPGLPSTLALDIALTGPQAQIVQIGLPELRNIGVDRGIPLFGAIGRTDDGFSVTLARDAVDGEQNVRLLTGRPWIDVPVRLQDGRRMTIAFEKGTAVRDMMRNALRLWRMPWLP
jgi:hypothetical protein